MCERFLGAGGGGHFEELFWSRHGLGAGDLNEANVI